MSQENVEVVVGHFENANARDFEAVMEAYADDVVAVPHGHLGTLLGEGAMGKEAVGAWFGDWFAGFGRDYRLEIEETRDLGDRVFLAATHHGHGRASGVPISGKTAWIYTLLQGKIVRCDLYADREAALEAVGLSDG